MNIADAALVFVTESAAYPCLEQLARSVHEELSWNRPVPHTVLSELINEASGKGVLGAMRQKYSPAAFESVITPILTEIGRTAPIRPRRQA